VGILDALMGNASEADAAEINAELSAVLADNEQVVHAYKMVRDLYVFTDKRLIAIDKQGVTGRKQVDCAIQCPDCRDFRHRL